jgi:hypothetical protein
LRRLTIEATDGNLGSVVDLCFDDRSWTIRYLVVDAGSWLPDRWMLGTGSEHPPQRAEQDAGQDQR